MRIGKSWKHVPLELSQPPGPSYPGQSPAPGRRKGKARVATVTATIMIAAGVGFVAACSGSSGPSSGPSSTSHTSTTTGQAVETALTALVNDDSQRDSLHLCS